jgi:hypothetical protein
MLVVFMRVQIRRKLNAIHPVGIKNKKAMKAQ